MKFRILMPMTVAASALFLGGCLPKQAVNTGDTSPPTAELKIKNADGQYVAAPATMPMNSFEGSIDLSCIISDDQGVHTAKLDIVGSTTSCNWDGKTTDGESIDGLPNSPSQVYTGDKNGKDDPGSSLTKAPLFASIKGPLSCTYPGTPPHKGQPIGGKVYVTCAGTNWSADKTKNTASQAMAVTLQ